MLETNKTYHYCAKQTTEKPKKKPCNNCHPKACTKTEERVECNPERDSV